jgi:membrane-associated phospholipid phosphatase
MPGRRLLVLAVAAGVGFAVVAVLHTVLGQLPGDAAAVRAARLFPGQGGYDGWRLLDQATDGLPQVAAAALLVLALGARRRWWQAAAVAVGFAAALGGGALLKRVWERPRPVLMAPVDDVSAFSFPAGHASGPAALALLLVLALAGWRWGRQVAVAAGLLVAATGFSQLALARHYPSDLLAGWSWGMAVAAASWAAAAAVAGRSDGARPAGIEPATKCLEGTCSIR